MADPDEPKPVVRMAQFASVGLEMGIAVAIGAFAGHFADNHFGTNPWLMLVGLLLGIGAGFKGLYDAAKKAKRSLESSKDRDEP